MRHYRLTLEDACDAHKKALSFGGLQGVIDLGLIESAISRPYSGYYRPIHRKAAALVQSLVGNHGFADGNKRTTVILLNSLLERSGYRLKTSKEVLQDMILGAARSELSFDDLVMWFERRIVRI